MPFITELISKVTNFRIKVGDKLNILKKEIGQLDSLTTNDKSSLVLAVNEVNRKAVVNDGKLTINATNGLIGSGSFTANQQSNSNIDIKIDDDTLTKINNGNVAHSWGNHASAGYLKLADISNKANTDGGNVINLPQWQNKLQIGNLATLTTTNKTSLVEAVNEVNNIQIGGRNLLFDSSKLIENSNYEIAVYKLSNEKYINGEDYTFTLWGDLGSDRTSFAVYNSGGGCKLSDLIKIKDGVYQATFKWTNTYEWNGSHIVDNTTINVYQTLSNAVTKSKISRIKLEKGNKATDWTPAIEDQVSNWAETNSDSLSFIKGKEIITNEFNNVYDQINARANNRLSNLASDLTAREKGTIRDKIGVVLQTVNDGKLTLTTGTGLNGSTNFTANQSSNSIFDVSVASTHKLPSTAEWYDTLKKDEENVVTSNFSISNVDGQSIKFNGDLSVDFINPYGIVRIGSDEDSAMTYDIGNGDYFKSGASGIYGKSGNGWYLRTKHASESQMIMPETGTTERVLTTGAKVGSTTYYANNQGVIELPEYIAPEYTAGNGLTLSGTTFSLPITVSGSGNYVSDVTQTTNGITVTKSTLPDLTGFVLKNGDNVTPNSKWNNYSKGIYGYLDTDYWRIQGNLVSPNNVELELATADDATESIVVRQYSGEFTSKVREAYLLDANGNTSFPENVTAQSFRMNGTTTTPAGVVSTESSIWQLGGDYGYGISMNAIGGLDIMANQPSQPIRLWSGQANANPYKSMEIRGSSISVYGTIFTSGHGDSSQWKQAFDWGDHKSVDTHQYLGATYVGGGLRKPSDFGAGRLKLEMVNGGPLGNDQGWNDVLWLSSYTGSDVKGSNALVFSKYTDEIGFLRQNFDSETWGTYRKIWHSGNFNPSSYLPLTGGELSNGDYNSEVLTAKGNIVVRGVESAYNLAFASKTTPFDIVSGHEYNWYNTYWKIGNRRGGTSDSIGFSFFLNGDEKLRIRPDGMVVGAKGYITEGFDLKVGKEAGNYIQFSEEETNHYGYNAFNGETVCTSTFVSEGLQINQSAHIGSNLTVTGDTTLTQLAASSISTIGSVDIQGSLFVNGASSFNNTVTAQAFYESSLRKYKTNIKPYKESALEVLKNIDIVTFDRTDSGIKNKIGVIADDSPSEILNEELNAVDLYKTVFVLTKAVQELQEEIKQLKQQVEAE